MFLGKGNGIFSHNRLPRRCVSRNKNRVMPLQMQDGLLLEHIRLKCPLWEREIDSSWRRERGPPASSSWGIQGACGMPEPGKASTKVQE